MFSKLCNFKNANGHCSVPKDYEMMPSLGNWVSIQRRDYKRGILSTDRAEKLTNLGFVWDPYYDQWEAMFAELLQYRSENGHCNVSQKSEKNLDLARWVGRQRASYRKGSICPDLKGELDAIDFNWEPFANSWEEMFNSLCEFQKEHSHCNVPARYQKNMKLGRWIDRQRQSYRNGQISQEYKERLEKLGLVWNPISDVWEDMYLKLCKFKIVNGHLNISKEHNEKKLISWVNWQRYNYKKGKLNEEYILKLTNLGVFLDK